MSDRLSAELSNPARLAALREAARTRPYPHPSFDTVTRVVARLLDVPLALVSLVDDREQFFAGASGLPDELLACRSTPLSHSFCKHVVATKAVLRIPDTRRHAIVHDNPAVEEFGIIAYLGVPVTTSEGHTLGSLAALAPHVREWTDAEVQLLIDLAETVSTELELRGELSFREEECRALDASVHAEGLQARSLDILESVQEGIAAVDREWRLTFLNRQAARVLGAERESVLGHPIWEQFPFLEHTSIAGALRSAASTRFPTQTAAYVPSLRRWFEVRTVPVRHGMSVYFHDITEQRDAEAALEQREAQLRYAQKMEAIGTLAGGVAHDFNNLLTVIRANVELLQSDASIQGAFRGELADIMGAATRASGLTQQLLAFSQRQMVQPRRMDVPAKLDALAPILRRLMPESVSLDTVAYPHVPTVLCDEGQMEQLFMNLVLNARDAMPSGGVIQVRLAPCTLRAPLPTVCGPLDPGRYLQIAVRDTGTGIPSDVLPRIFEPFFSTKHSGQGTGLGLATVFGIVQHANGGIVVESAPGSGTIFRIYLRALVDVAPQPDPRVSGTGTERILVTDDEPGIRAVMQRVLEARGYDTRVAADGAMALQQLDGVDLLVTDVVMPVMSGIELASTARRDRPELPVLLMSGYGDQPAVLRQLQEPSTDFLQKPFNADALETAVRQILDQRERRPSGPTES